MNKFYVLADALDYIEAHLRENVTQQEIADKLGIGQPMVSKHIKKIKKALLKFDPDIKKILYLFKKT